MKRFLPGFVGLFVGLLLVGSVVLLTAQPTQPPGSGSFASPATHTQTTVTSATTLTLTPDAPGQSIYLTEIDIQNCAGSSAVTAAAITTITTTNIDGGLAFSVGSGVAAGLCQPVQAVVYPTGLRSATSSLPVTFVLPTFATNQFIRVNIVYRSAP